MPIVLKILFYPLFAAITFVLFSIFLFPFDSAKFWLARQLEQGMGGTHTISIGQASPSLPSGVTLRDVEISSRDRTGTPPTGAPPVKISKVRLQFALLPLLAGSTEVDFDLRGAAAARGKAVGFYSSKKGAIELKLKLDRYDLSFLSLLLPPKPAFPLTGLLSGNLQIEVTPQDPLRNAGKAALELSDLRLGEMNFGEGEGVIQIPSIQIAPAAGPASRIEVLIQRGNLEVQKFQFSGGDLELQIEGKIYGGRQIENYRFNLQGTLKVAPALAPKIPFLAIVEKQKSPDGSYPLTITGRLSSPSIRVGEFKVPL